MSSLSGFLSMLHFNSEVVSAISHYVYRTRMIWKLHPPGAYRASLSIQAALEHLLATGLEIPLSAANVEVERPLFV